MKKLVLISVLLTGCASVPHESGKDFIQPAQVPLARAQQTAQGLVETGAQPHDPKVNSLVLDLNQTEVGLDNMTKQWDTVSADDAKKTNDLTNAHKRIYWDDLIMGIPVAIIGGLMIFNVVKVFML